MAFAAVAAVFSGAAVSAATVMSAVATIGATMSVVGMVTGSKSLMKIGGVMSLVGGVGGLVAGAASAAGGALTAEAGGAAASAVGDVAASAGSEALTASAGALESGLSPGLIEGGVQNLGGELAANAAGNMAAPAMNAAQNAVGNVVELGAAPSITPAASEASSGIVSMTGPQATVTPMDTSIGVRAPADSFGIKNLGASFSSPQPSGGFWDSMSTWAERNKTLLNSGMQVVGGALKGANERAMWDEKMALDRDRLKLQSYGSQTANFAPGAIVTGGAR